MPPGRICGCTCATSVFSTGRVVNGVGVPPVAATLQMPSRWLKTIRSSSAQVAPNGSPASDSFTAGPPTRDTFLRAPADQKPTHCPSGEKNGPSAPSVPGTSSAAARSNDRTYSDCRPSRRAVNAMARPSDERAIAVRLGRGGPNLPSSGDAPSSASAGLTSIWKRDTGDGGDVDPERPSHQPIPNAAVTSSTPATAPAHRGVDRTATPVDAAVGANASASRASRASPMSRRRCRGFRSRQRRSR